MLLIVHADDYGLTQSVSLGILDAHTKGICTSTSVLMTHATPKELHWLRHEDRLDVGVHLNLTSGTPVMPLSDVPHLVRERRTFDVPRIESDDPHKRFDFSAIPEREIRLECEAQIKAASDAGLVPTHLDTHHHIHRDPYLFDLVLEFALHYRLALRTLDARQRAACHANAVPTTAVFLGEFFGHGQIGAPDLLACLAALPGAPSAELMCHPGRVSDELPFLSKYAAEREAELAVLTDPAVSSALTGMGITLGGWPALPA